MFPEYPDPFESIRKSLKPMMEMQKAIYRATEPFRMQTQMQARIPNELISALEGFHKSIETSALGELRLLQQLIARQMELVPKWTPIYLPTHQLFEAYSTLVERPWTRLTDSLVKSGLDSEDLHTPTFLRLIAAVRTDANTDERQDFSREPLLRLLTAYDIVMVLERDLREWVRTSIEQEYGESWWAQVPPAVQSAC